MVAQLAMAGFVSHVSGLKPNSHSSKCLAGRFLCNGLIIRKQDNIIPNCWMHDFQHATIILQF